MLANPIMLGLDSVEHHENLTKEEMQAKFNDVQKIANDFYETEGGVLGIFVASIGFRLIDELPV